MKNKFKVGLFPPKGSVQLEKLLSELKSLGFEYSEVESESAYEISLPSKWKAVFGEEPGFNIPCFNIYDEQGRKRGWISRKKNKNSIQRIGIYTRYYVGTIENNERYVVIFDRSKNEIVYQVGRFYDCYDEYTVLCKAEEYLEANFPDYKKINAYWDEEETK